MAPDGKTVAVIVSRANLQEDRSEGELDLIDISSRQIKVLVKGRTGLEMPRWSPDGSTIAFLAQDAGKRAQVFLQPASGGEARQLTTAKTAVRLLAWRPDGAALAFAAPDEAAEKKGEARFDDGFEVGNNDYTQRSRQQPIHIWTVAVSDGAAKRLTHGDWSVPNRLPPRAFSPVQMAWTADGQSIVFEKADTPISGDLDSTRLVVLNASTGAMHDIAPLMDAQSHPFPSPDGRQIAYISGRDGVKGNENAIYVTAINGAGHPVDVAKALDREPHIVGWMPGGKALAMTGNDGTQSAIWIQPIGGKAVRLALGGLTPTGDASIGRNGAMVFEASAADHPVEIYYLQRAGAAPVQLTHLQTVTDGITLGRQETVTWTSDGVTLSGVLTYPPNYVPGKQLPLVLYLHGGPRAASLETFTPQSQILAAHGWLVFEPNYRGSNNQGNAFETGYVRDAGTGPGRDVMAGVSHIEELGLVDDRRVAVTGWSYGGYLTAWLIGNYPQVWRAAVAGAPITDLVDQYSLTDSNAEQAKTLGPSPFVGDNLKDYQMQSPISYAWKTKAPTLIMSDVGDWRVTTTQAYKLYHALKDNNVPVTFIAYPVPGHMPSDPVRARDIWRRWTAWLTKYLDDPLAPTR